MTKLTNTMLRALSAINALRLPKSSKKAGCETSLHELPDEEKPYQCRVCHKSFGLANNFSKHRRIHCDEDNVKVGNCNNVGLAARNT